MDKAEIALDVPLEASVDAREVLGQGPGSSRYGTLLEYSVKKDDLRRLSSGDVDGERRISAVCHHQTKGPFALALLDPAPRPLFADTKVPSSM